MPAPQARVPKGAIVTDSSTNMANGQEDLIDLKEEQKDPHPALRRLATSDKPIAKANGSPDPATRRSSSIVGASQKDGQRKPKDLAKNIGPSNLASRPRTTRYNTVKIKPGGAGLADTTHKSHNHESPSEPRRLSASTAPQGGVGAGLLSSAGKDAKDGVIAVQAGYGTMGVSPPQSKGRDSVPGNIDQITPKRRRDDEDRTEGDRQPSNGRGRESSQSSTVGSLRSIGSRSRSKTGVARSGSLSENVVHAGGFKKTVLETTSSSEDADGNGSGGAKVRGEYDGANDAATKESSKGGSSSEGGQGSQKKKRRRKKRSGRKGDEQPLMEEGEDN